MKPFVGRRRELALLEEAYLSPASAFVPVYGRRRVGKSELLLRFLAGKRCVYLAGKQAPAGLQIREFLEVASAAVGEPLLATLPAAGWREALEAVEARWPAGQKLVLCFDEFQCTAAASPELPSILQELWDRRWKPAGRALLVLCGSYLGFMEREVLGRRSPLFGRRTAQILLRPFSYLEARELHPRLSPEEQARAWFICGGVPLYHEHLGGERSVELGIRRALLDEHGPLFREPDFLLREELRELPQYHAVLLALARGSLPPKELAERSGIAARSLGYYLRQLEALGYAGRRLPLSGAAPAARSVRHELGDPLLCFWFRFVFPNTSLLAQLGPERTFDVRVRRELPAYFGRCFERLAREALPRLYAREGVSAPFEIGEYWDRELQVDVVGLREDGWIDLGECKWGPVRSPRRVARELEQAAERFPNPRNLSIARRVFTRAKRPASPPPGVRWHDLAELWSL